MKKLLIFLLSGACLMGVSACSIDDIEDEVVDEITSLETETDDFFEDDTNKTEATGSEVTLSYSSLEEWIDEGYSGSAEGETFVLIGMNEGCTYGLVVLADDTTKEALVFEGDLTLNAYDSSFSITDKTSGAVFSALIEDTGDDSYSLDMGEYGTALVEETDSDELLSEIKPLIYSYTFTVGQ